MWINFSMYVFCVGFSSRTETPMCWLLGLWKWATRPLLPLIIELRYVTVIGNSFNAGGSGFVSSQPHNTAQRKQN